MIFSIAVTDHLHADIVVKRTVTIAEIVQQKTLRQKLVEKSKRQKPGHRQGVDITVLPEKKISS